MLEDNKTSEEQPTARKQDDGQSDLRDDEHVAQLPATPPHDGSSSGRLQRVVRVEPRDVKGRGQCEEHTDHSADEQREREYGPVDSRLGESRDLRRSDRDESPRSPDGCRRANDAGNDREHEAFHKQLSDDADRLAPRAARMAISWTRPVAFASNRVATFAHAMRRTRPTAPSSRYSIAPASPTASSSSGVRATPLPLFDRGYACSSRLAIDVISARASGRVTSRFSRPIARLLLAERFVTDGLAMAVAGNQISVPSGKSNACGRTPTMVIGRSNTRSTRPSARDGSAKCRRA